MTYEEAEHLLKARRDPTRPAYRATEWLGDPAFTAEEARIWDAARRRKWIAALSKRDWERISAMVDQTVSSFRPAALDDLDCGFRVGATLPASATSGQPFGSMRGRTLVAFPPERERR